MLCNPLHLRFWMRTFRDRAASPVAGLGELSAAYLDDEGAHAIHDAWQKATDAWNWRDEMSPLELLATEGILQKRVDEEGGGYRVPFQQLREYLLFSRMLDENAGLSLETAIRWAFRPLRHEDSPDYAGMFAFAVHRWASRDQAGYVAGLLGMEGLSKAIQDIVVNVLAERILSAEGAEREHCLRFLEDVLKAPTPASDDSVRLARLYLWKVVPRLNDWARRSDLIAVLDATAHTLEAATQVRPAELSLVLDLSVSYDRLGDVHSSAGDAGRARDYYGRGLAIAEELHRKVPYSDDYARNLWVSYERLGDVHRSAGDAGRARDYYERALAIAEELPDSGD